MRIPERSSGNACFRRRIREIRTGTAEHAGYGADGRSPPCSSGRIRTAYKTAGIKTVLVKARDDDGVESSKLDTIQIIVHSYAPRAVAMLDTNVGVNDSYFIRATGTDTNGTIRKYLWALNGVSFTDSTDSGRVRTVFTTVGIKTVLVKVPVS